MTDQPDIVARLREYTRHNKPVLASDLKEAADCIEGQRRLHNDLLTLHLDFVRSIADLVGDKAPPAEQRYFACDKHGLEMLAGKVSAIRRDRDALLPQDLPVDDPTAPAQARTWDEVDRRIAELESRVRLTERHLEVAALSLHSALDPTPKSICSRLVNVWSRTTEGLIDLEMAIKEDRRRG